MQSDERLIHELKQGIQSSMEILIKRHYNMVFAYIYRYSGDYHTSYDLTQETFIKMVRYIDSVSQRDRFKYWLLKIALNTCRDYFKSRAFKTAEMSKEWDESMENTSGNLFDMFEHKVDSIWIRDALLILSPLQRETIILRFYHDLTIREISELSSVGEPTIKYRINKGLSKLKKQLERIPSHEKKKYVSQ